jgi:hypothetical protein
MIDVREKKICRKLIGHDVEFDDIVGRMIDGLSKAGFWIE